MPSKPIPESLRHYKCITLTPEGRIYNLDHVWVEHKHLFGLLWWYQCSDCKIKLRRNEWLRSNSALYKELFYDE